MSKLVVLLSLVMLLTACNSASTRKAQYRLQGTYALQRQEAAITLCDTLVITPVAAKATHLFTIERRINIVQVPESRHPAVPRTRLIRLSAEYDPAQNYLYVYETGEHYVMQDDGHTLTNGIVAYTRVK